MSGRRLPDCPHCDAASTLEARRVDAGGIIVCVCSCCARTSRVRPTDAPAHPTPPREVDVRGHVVDEV